MSPSRGRNTEGIPVPSTPDANVSAKSASTTRTHTERRSITIDFTSVDDVYKTIRQEMTSLSFDDVVLTIQSPSRISPKAFSDLDSQRERRKPKFLARRYMAGLALLIIMVPNSPFHEPLHRSLWSKIERAIELMGLELSWTDKGNMTLPAHCRGGDRGEGDSTGGPTPDRAGDAGWPTIVIEAGVSETLDQLREDMRWWFTTSDHLVKIVLLAKTVLSERTIVLEKWTEAPVRESRNGPMTRVAAGVQPNLDQVITITNPTISNDPATFVVHSGTLHLEFNLLFLRQPALGESDITLDIDTLRVYAARVWLAQNA